MESVLPARSRLPAGHRARACEQPSGDRRPAGAHRSRNVYLLEKKTLMTGEVIADARPRPDTNVPGNYLVELILQRARREAVRGHHVEERRPPARDRARQHRVLGAAHPGTHRRRPRGHHRQLRHPGSARSRHRAPRRRAAGSGDDRRGAHGRARRSGRDSIRQGMLSFAVGAGLVVVFMAIYYRGAGLLADAARCCQRRCSCSPVLRRSGDADAAGHRRHRAHDRHGGRRERADQRAHP